MLLPDKFKRFLFRSSLVPPKEWRPAAAIVGAIICGLGLFILDFSNASSYLSDDPQACVNCHVMQPQFVTWNHSSHREVADCNACHVPHDNAFNKYTFKAMDGLYHSYVFTTRSEPEVMRARPASVEVIQNNCIRCHQDQVTDAKTASYVSNHMTNRTDRTCWECHREVPHGRARSLSSVGAQIEPIREYSPKDLSVVPTWLKESLKQDKPKTER